MLAEVFLCLRNALRAFLRSRTRLPDPQDALLAPQATEFGHPRSQRFERRLDGAERTYALISWASQRFFGMD